jgi:hypothetical protein
MNINKCCSSRQESIALKLRTIPEECIVIYLLQWLHCRVCSYTYSSDCIAESVAVFNNETLINYSTQGYFLTFFQPGIESYIFILFATIATFCTQVIESSPLCFSSSWWLLPLLPHTRSTPSSTLMNNLGIICAMMLELQASPKSFLNSSARCS